MQLFTLEHSQSAYRADFAFYSVASISLTIFLMFASPYDQGHQILALIMVGLICWTFIEYLLHRFILHGLVPFNKWHDLHHERPSALIYTPTIFSACLIAAFIFMPIFIFTNIWIASAFTLGILLGYLAYTFMHHAIHHLQMDSQWLKQRRRWHALHHIDSHKYVREAGHYGVTTDFWDHVFGTIILPRKRAEIVPVIAITIPMKTNL